MYPLGRIYSLIAILVALFLPASVHGVPYPHSKFEVGSAEMSFRATLIVATAKEQTEMNQLVTKFQKAEDILGDSFFVTDDEILKRSIILYNKNCTPTCKSDCYDMYPYIKGGGKLNNKCERN